MCGRARHGLCLAWNKGHPWTSRRVHTVAPNTQSSCEGTCRLGKSEVVPDCDTQPSDSGEGLRKRARKRLVTMAETHFLDESEYRRVSSRWRPLSPRPRVRPQPVGRPRYVSPFQNACRRFPCGPGYSHAGPPSRGRASGAGGRASGQTVTEWAGRADDWVLYVPRKEGSTLSGLSFL